MDEIECSKCIYNINNECEIGGWTIPKVGCEDGKEKPQTNADRIRAMTDEELADAFHLEGCPKGKWITDCLCDLMREPYPHECKKCWLEWLKQECES